MRTLAALVIVTSGLAATTLTPVRAQADDFAFTLMASSCPGYTVDTFQGTWSRRGMGDTVQPVSLPFTLTREEQVRVRDKVQAIKFFEYPAFYHVEVRPGETVVAAQPAVRFILRVRLGGREHQVSWSSEILSPSPAAYVGLRELAALIGGIANGRPDVQNVPPWPFQCA